MRKQFLIAFLFASLAQAACTSSMNHDTSRQADETVQAAKQQATSQFASTDIIQKSTATQTPNLPLTATISAAHTSVVGRRTENARLQEREKNYIIITPQDPRVANEITLLISRTNHHLYIEDSEGVMRTLIKDCVSDLSSDVNGMFSFFVGCPDEEYSHGRLLTILHLKDLSIQPLVDVFSYYGDTDIPDELSNPIRQAWAPISWSYPAFSPDGRYLAFMAAIDGPTSDAYLYDVVDDHIERISSGTNQAGSVYGNPGGFNSMWTPDGSGFIHAEYAVEPDAEGVLGYYGKALWWWPIAHPALLRFANNVPNEKVAIIFQLPFGGWLNPHRFLFRHDHFVNGGIDLLAGDVFTGSTTKLLEGVVDVTSMYSESGGAALAAVIKGDSLVYEIFLVDGLTLEVSGPLPGLRLGLGMEIELDPDGRGFLIKQAQWLYLVTTEGDIVKLK